MRQSIGMALSVMAYKNTKGSRSLGGGEDTFVVGMHWLGVKFPGPFLAGNCAKTPIHWVPM